MDHRNRSWKYGSLFRASCYVQVKQVRENINLSDSCQKSPAEYRVLVQPTTLFVSRQSRKPFDYYTSERVTYLYTLDFTQRLLTRCVVNNAHVMADKDQLEREAAICENCGAATAVRVSPDGNIRPIGGMKGSCCEDSTLRIMNEDTDEL